MLSLETTLAARNARLSEALRQIEQDLEVAARIQQSVLPAHQLRYRGTFSDWIFLPSAWVSGDIFNVFPLDNHLGFYCVDVSGHGVGAAMMSLAVARQFLHGRAVERFMFTADNEVASPAEVVQILNGRFCSDEVEIVSYFTMIYGALATGGVAGAAACPAARRRGVALCAGSRRLRDGDQYYPLCPARGCGMPFYRGMYRQRRERDAAFYRRGGALSCRASCGGAE